MANATLYQASDMLDPNFYGISNVNRTDATTTRLEIGFTTGAEDVFYGSFVLSGNSSAPIQSGTISTVEYWFGSLVAQATGLNHSAVTVQNYYLDEDGLGLQSYLLNGNDVGTGSSGNDRMIGWSGDDTVYGGGGRDTLLGHTGNDR